MTAAATAAVAAAPRERAANASFSSMSMLSNWSDGESDTDYYLDHHDIIDDAAKGGAALAAPSEAHDVSGHRGNPETSQYSDEDEDAMDEGGAHADSPRGHRQVNLRQQRIRNRRRKNCLMLREGLHIAPSPLGPRSHVTPIWNQREFHTYITRDDHNLCVWIVTSSICPHSQRLMPFFMDSFIPKPTTSKAHGGKKRRGPLRHVRYFHTELLPRHLIIAPLVAVDDKYAATHQRPSLLEQEAMRRKVLEDLYALFAPSASDAAESPPVPVPLHGTPTIYFFLKGKLLADTPPIVGSCVEYLKAYLHNAVVRRNQEMREYDEQKREEECNERQLAREREREARVKARQLQKQKRREQKLQAMKSKTKPSNLLDDDDEYDEDDEEED